MVSPVRVFAITLLVFGVMGALGAGVMTAVADGNGSAAKTEVTNQQSAGATPQVYGTAQDIDIDNRTTWRVDVQVDGDAHWSIETRFNITSDTDEAAFQELASSFLDGEETQLGLPEFRTAVDRVDDGTERNMELIEEERLWSIDGEGVNRTGRLELRFTWKNFARVEDDGIYIDEAVLTADGAVWFRGLAADQTLVIRPPEGYGVDDANVAPQNGALRWTGPTNFDAESLRATFVGVPGNGGNGDNGTDGPNGPDDNDASMLPIIGAFAILVLAVAMVLISQRGQLRDHLGTATSAESGESTSEGAGSTDAADGGTEEAVVAGTAAMAEDTTDESDDGVDLDLLSDEERIEHLLESNGGRMKQANIVKETDWSNAKVSQLLSSMEEDDQIDKLRIGRENLISFPDQEITDFEDE